MSGVQIITIPEEDEGQRLDRWFKRLFPHVPQGRVEKMCRKGEIRVDGGRVKGSTRLEVGQQVRIPPLPDPSDAPSQPARKTISDADAQMIRA